MATATEEPQRHRKRRRKKRRRSKDAYKPMRTGILLGSFFLGLAALVGFCLWAIIPSALEYLQMTLGW